MRNGFLASLAVLLAGAGLALAQAQPTDQSDILEQNSLPADTHNAFDPDQPDHCNYFWASGEYLLWWMTKSPVPVPLVTTGPPVVSTTIGLVPGLVGAPTTRVLFGGQDYDDARRSGGRATIGWCLQAEHRLDLEASIFALGDRSKDFAASSDVTGFPTLTRPVINARTGRETALNVALLGEFTGSVSASLNSSIFGVEANAFYNPFNRFAEYPDFLIGFRYLNLDETLDIGQTSRIIDPQALAGFNGLLVGERSTLSVYDRFDTLNQFFGGQIGLRHQFERGCYFLNVLAAVGIGDTHQNNKIQGASHLLTFNGVSSTVPGGLLALRSNIGNSSNDEFSVVPELRVTIGMYVTPRLQASFGYNFLYWSSVIRPGTEVDRRVNSTELPTSVSFGAQNGPLAPTVQFNQRDLILQGFNFGLSYRF